MQQLLTIEIIVKGGDVVKVTPKEQPKTTTPATAAQPPKAIHRRKFCPTCNKAFLRSGWLKKHRVKEHGAQ